MVNLFNNHIGDEGIKDLADGLEENRTLTVMDLANNRFGDAGAVALARALKVLAYI